MHSHMRRLVSERLMARPPAHIVCSINTQTANFTISRRDNGLFDNLQVAEQTLRGRDEEPVEDTNAIFSSGSSDI